MNPPVDSFDDGPTLGQRAARGAATTLAAQFARIFVQSATLVVLSRLLSTESFGLVAAVTAFTGIADLIRDFGLSSAAMQAKFLTEHQRSNLFWLNTMTGLLAGVVTFTCASPIAALYGSHKLIHITQLLSLVFIFDGLSTQYRADLNRRLRFAGVAMADIVSQTVAGAAAISLAAVSPGTAPLVLLPILQSAVAMVALVALLRWRPGLPRRGTGMRPFLSFGVSLFFVQLVTYASRNADNVTVGRRFGPVSLGIYSRAFQFLELPLNQLSAPMTTVALPILARLQDDKQRLTAFVHRGQNLLMQLTLLLLTIAASQAHSLIPLILGDQWRASVPIFQILAVGGAFQTAGYAPYWLFLATGKTTSILRYSLVARPLTIAAIVIGSLWGVQGVAWGFALSLVCAWPFGLWWVGHTTQTSTWPLFTSGLRTILCYGLCGVAAWRLPIALFTGLVPQLAAGIFVLFFTLGILAASVPAFRRDLLDVASTVELLAGRQLQLKRLGARAGPKHRLPPRG